MRVDFSGHDRLLVALFGAALFHALLILGVSFEFPKPQRIQKALDIVLVRTPSPQAPERADFLAPEHQLGSGSAKEKAIPRTAPLPQPGLGAELPLPLPQQQPVTAAKTAPKPKLTQPKAEKKVAAEAGENRPAEVEQTRLSARLEQEIAEISARLSVSQEFQAKEPKVVYINQVSAHKYKAAAYEAAWQQKIERIGNLNYPQDARHKNLSGSLTVAVGIKQDGSLHSIKVLESSGVAALDEAAQRIVRLAAPYAAFPEELKPEADVLVITRTWRFTSGHRMETGR